jgi:hypothetical protein
MATDIQTTEDDYYEACDRAEEAEAKAADAERWAKFYHDTLIALRDALPDVIDCAEAQARFNDGVWEPLALVKAILRRIDEPTATDEDVKAWAKAEVDELDRITAWKRGGELLYGDKAK